MQILGGMTHMIVYCRTGGKKVYFMSVKFDARAKRGQQSQE